MNKINWTESSKYELDSITGWHKHIKHSRVMIKVPDC